MVRWVILQIAKADTTVQTKLKANNKQKDNSNKNIMTNGTVQNDRLIRLSRRKNFNVYMTNFSTLNRKEIIRSANSVNEKQQDSNLNSQDNKILETNTFKLNDFK